MIGCARVEITRVTKGASVVLIAFPSAYLSSSSRYCAWQSRFERFLHDSSPLRIRN